MRTEQERTFWITVFMAAYEAEKGTVESAAIEADKALAAFRKANEPWKDNS